MYTKYKKGNGLRCLTKFRKTKEILIKNRYSNRGNYGIYVIISLLFNIHNTFTGHAYIFSLDECWEKRELLLRIIRIVIIIIIIIIIIMRFIKTVETNIVEMQRTLIVSTLLEMLWKFWGVIMFLNDNNIGLQIKNFQSNI